jgi:hypothetical protein
VPLSFCVWLNIEPSAMGAGFSDSMAGRCER